jgi:hypothetical protein
MIRIGRFLRARMRSPAAPAKASPPTDGGALPVSLFDDAVTVRSAIVTLLGVPPADLAATIDRCLAVMARYDRLVFLTDSLDFTPFRARRVIFEYWPAPALAEAEHPDLDWAEYLSAKRELLYSKWGINLEVRFGISLEDRIAAAARYRTGSAERTPGAAAGSRQPGVAQ